MSWAFCWGPNVVQPWFSTLQLRLLTWWRQWSTLIHVAIITSASSDPLITPWVAITSLSHYPGKAMRTGRTGVPWQSIRTDPFTEEKTLSFWWNVYHWLHWKLSLCKLGAVTDENYKIGTWKISSDMKYVNFKYIFVNDTLSICQEIAIRWKSQ